MGTTLHLGMRRKLWAKLPARRRTSPLRQGKVNDAHASISGRARNGSGFTQRWLIHDRRQRLHGILVSQFLLCIG
jgi:hypothetical protein